MVNGADDEPKTITNQDHFRLVPVKRGDPASVGNRLRLIRERLRLTQKEAASMFALGENSWARLEREDRAPKGEILAKLAEMGYSIDWLLTGDGQLIRDDQAVSRRLDEIFALLEHEPAPIGHDRLAARPDLQAIKRELEELSAGAELQKDRLAADRLLAITYGDKAAEQRTDDAETRIIRAWSTGTVRGCGVGGFVSIPLYDIRAAAGPGALVEREKIETEIAFRADWLRSLGVSPERLAVIYAVGNSMEPIIRHGDALLLELEPDHLIEGGIYVIARDGELMIKRPQKLGAKGLVLLSDNPDYQPVTYPAEEAAAMRIVGRVRWIGRVV